MWITYTSLFIRKTDNNKLYRLNSGSSPLCSKPRRKFVQTSYALKSQLIGLIFVADSKSHAHSVTHIASAKSHNVSTSSVPSVKRTLSWIGHWRPFNCLLVPAEIQNERMCCRNVPLMPTLLLERMKIQRENGKFDFNDPTQIWRLEPIPARNAFEYLQMIYIALTYILALTWRWVYVH